MILEYLFTGRFQPYLRTGRCETTWLNLMEVYYALLRDGQPETVAAEAIAAFEACLVDFTFEDVKGAMELGLRWQKEGKRISYVDAVCYFLAQNRRYQFLTGDSAFRRARGVTFLQTGSRA